MMDDDLEHKDKRHKYALRYYNNPTFGIWHEWFAWYPVRTITFEGFPDVEHMYLKTQRWVWLQKVARRKVIDDLIGPGREGIFPSTKKHYEYTTLMELLRGH